MGANVIIAAAGSANRMQGVDKILFGSDYPTCNPAMYIGGVLLDDLITPEEKQKIFYDNAKRLLGIE